MPDWRELLQISPGAGRLDPGKLSLSTLLAGINVLLVIIVIGGISWIAVDLLGDLADNQGLARVQVAGSSVREDIREIADETLLATRAMADRPTLQRLWREQHLRSLAAYLKRICQTGGITGCALTAPGSSLIIAGKALPWDDILNASAEQGERQHRRDGEEHQTEAGVAAGQNAEGGAGIPDVREAEVIGDDRDGFVQPHPAGDLPFGQLVECHHSHDDG